MKKKDVILAFGSQSHVARALGISRQAVNRWPDDVPRLRVYQIEDQHPERIALLACDKD